MAAVIALAKELLSAHVGAKASFAALRDTLHRCVLRIGVRVQEVDSESAVNAVLPDVAEVREEVRATLLHELDVVHGVRLAQGLARDDPWFLAAVQLQRADRADHDGAIGLEVAVLALDAEELLSAHVGAETGLRQQVAVLADQSSPILSAMIEEWQAPGLACPPPYAWCWGTAPPP